MLLRSTTLLLATLLLTSPAHAQRIALLVPKMESNGLPNTQQEFLLLGTVLTEADEPLSGATLMIAGTRQVVATDADGAFVLPVNLTAGPVQLVCAYAGREEQIVTISTKNQNNLRILLASKPAPVLPATGVVREL
ncbi:carboxypeptidase-like regulatory domain-containing protein [Hymenobacter canadensis]|uniref:Carboxypeptidase-like regulatory domain-containing protein n=1 Tax=Hymenobacter canadensis TaxID=2999067 RepID=A0ABY7LXW3_9BACT|nr:carboxypeptidase-like regulatory domain-containing protein [Hymenobacter canadensis]WBA44110.1 carboxypeptidase-like regulatory domain-containing protein [Hymenobacter canadensis]